MSQYWGWMIFLAIVIAVIVVVVLAIYGVFGQGLTTAQQLGPDAPADQKPVIAKRMDNGKYQVVLSTYTKADTGSGRNWNQVYYIMYNPVTSSDASQTVFDDYNAAYRYFNSAYVATPLNKAYSNVSTTLLNADYSNIKPVF